MISAGIAADDDGPAVGLLLALEWPGGSRVPLPFVIGQTGDVRSAAFELGELAMRALGATTLPAAPSDFTCALATILPHARTQLLSLSAYRRGAESASPCRRQAIETLVRAAHRAEQARDIAASESIGRALAALRHDLPAGLNRLLGRLLQGGAQSARLAHQIQDCIVPALPPGGPALEGTPRLVLIAAVALASRCPSA